MPDLTRDAWAHLIPHAGAMCLLDAVREYDATSITCATLSHLRSDNPLRSDGRLNAVCGIEYAAQAAAIHGGLTNADTGRKPKSGYLAAVRGFTQTVTRLDDIDAELIVGARQLMLDESSCIYEFTVSAGDRELMRGRLTVVQNF